MELENAKNTFVLQSTDENFKESLIEFLSNHCTKNEVHTAYFEMDHEGSQKVMAIVTD
ncbi:MULTISPECIES: hypothetical protein [unclassified Psychrobacillus]|uniref:hypothetical protein n=1 Tax=unclassified Psychrobacillus TaxID=2636677 RepID=UPI0030FA27CB